MLTLDGTASARAAASVRGKPLCIDLNFSTGMLRVTNWNEVLTIGGNNYTPLGSLLQVSGLEESENSRPNNLTLSIPVMRSDMLAACTGPSTVYRGRSVVIYAMFIDDTYRPAGAAVERWRGQMSGVGIDRKPKKLESIGQTSMGTISLTCVRNGGDRVRSGEGLRLTDAQQKSRYPGDRGLEYMQGLIENPTLWLSKKFQDFQE